jgi:hypothetical protein
MSPGASRTVARVLAVGLLLASAPAVQAGPPLICRTFDAGTASLLPWGDGKGWHTPDRSYAVQRLTGDTLRLLSADAPVLARMENLRRATIYASRDGRVAAELLTALLGRALTAAADGRGDPLAWFDAGYLVESYRQLDEALRGGDHAPSLPLGAGAPDGYRLVMKAVELSGANPEMEFAASLMTRGPVSAEHRARATAGASGDPLLARNLSR